MTRERQWRNQWYDRFVYLSNAHELLCVYFRPFVSRSRQQETGSNQIRRIDWQSIQYRSTHFFSHLRIVSELDASSVKAVWKLKLKTSAGGRAKQRRRGEWEFMFTSMVTMFVSKWCHFVVLRCWYLLIELHQRIDDLCSNLARYSSRAQTTCSKNLLCIDLSILQRDKREW